MYKIYLSFLVYAVFAITSPCFASEEDSDETKEIMAKGTKLVLGIAESYNRLPVLYKEGKYEQILQEAVYPGELQFLSMMTLDVQEKLLYLYDRYMGMACYKMAVKHSENTELVTAFTDDARRFLQHYLDWVGEYAHPDNSPRELVFVTQLNSAQVYGDLGVIYSQLFPDKLLGKANLDEAKPGLELFGLCVLSLEHARKIYKATAKSLPNYATILKEHEGCIFEALSKGIVILRTCNVCIKRALKAEIREYNKKVLAPLNKDLAAKIQAQLDEAKSQTTPKKAQGYKKLGRETRNMLDQNEAKDRMAEISSASSQILSCSNLLTITDPVGQRSAIQINMFGLCADCFRFQNQKQLFASLEQRLYELEELLSTYYGLGTDIRAIYRQLHGCFDEEVHRVSLPLLTVALMNTGKIDGAIERLDALMEAQQQEYGKVDPFARTLYVYYKQLAGDPLPWLEYEKEKAEHAVSKSAEKKKKKAVARQVIAEAIKESLVEKEREKVTPPVVPTAALPVVRPVARNDKEKEEVEFVPSEDFKPLDQLKAEKAARHAANKDERDRKAIEAAQKPQMIEVSARPVQAAVMEETIPVISLVKAYNLKSTAKTVDEAIESGIWNVTREQLKTYFKAMGCEYRSGRGIHEVLTLPSQISVDSQNKAFDFNSTHVVKDGKVVTVFIDMGGSLTLPSWDKGYVPDYLKQQIISARNQLKKLAYKAQQELMKAKE